MKRMKKKKTMLWGEFRKKLGLFIYYIYIYIYIVRTYVELVRTYVIVNWLIF